MENLEISAQGILSLFETTKAQRQSFCIDIISRLENGEADPLKVHLQVKAMEDLIDQLTKNPVYKSYLLDEAAKHGKSFEYINAKFEVKEMGVKYDFAGCQDSEMASLMAQEAILKDQIKKRGDFLKTVPLSGMTIVDPNTGNVETVYPPVKTSTTAISVKLP